MEKNKSRSLMFCFYTKGDYKISDDARKLIARLSLDLEFEKEIFLLRDKFEISDPEIWQPYDAISTFHNLVEKWGTTKHAQFIMGVSNIVEQFGLPIWWLITIKYLTGAGFLMEPKPALLVKKHPLESGSVQTKSVALLVTGNYSQDELIEVIRNKWKEIKPLLQELPDIPKIISHKDSMTEEIEQYVISLRDRDEYKFPEIANKLSELSSEHPDWFGNKIITKSDAELRNVYRRAKEKTSKFKRIKTS